MNRAAELEHLEHSSHMERLRARAHTSNKEELFQPFRDLPPHASSAAGLPLDREHLQQLCDAWRRPTEPTRVSQALAAAIERACEVRGDDPPHRDGLIAECMALPVEAQADLLAHFTAEATR